MIVVMEAAPLEEVMPDVARLVHFGSSGGVDRVVLKDSVRRCRAAPAPEILGIGRGRAQSSPNGGKQLYAAAMFHVKHR